MAYVRALIITNAARRQFFLEASQGQSWSKETSTYIKSIAGTPRRVRQLMWMPKFSLSKIDYI